MKKLDEFCDVIYVKPHYAKMYDCYQNAVMAALEGIGESTDYIMLGTWGFGFRVDEAIHIGCGSKIYTSDLECVKNIVLKKYAETDVDKIFDAAATALAKHMPLILFQDTFYNPWSLFYEKKHTDHFFVVIGIDKERKRLLCVDNYASDDYQILERKHMERGGLKEYLTVEKKEGSRKTRAELAKYLYDEICKKLTLKYSPFYYLREFTKIEKLKAIVERIDNIEISEEMRKLTRVRDMRKGLAEDLLRFTDAPDLTRFGNQMLESSQFFARLVILIIKCKKIPAKQNMFLEKISQAAHEIYDVEKNCICEMHQYLEDYFGMEQK